MRSHGCAEQAASRFREGVLTPSVCSETRIHLPAPERGRAFVRVVSKISEEGKRYATFSVDESAIVDRVREGVKKAFPAGIEGNDKVLALLDRRLPPESTDLPVVVDPQGTRLLETEILAKSGPPTACTLFGSRKMEEAWSSIVASTGYMLHGPDPNSNFASLPGSLEPWTLPPVAKYAKSKEEFEPRDDDIVLKLCGDFEQVMREEMLAHGIKLN